MAADIQDKERKQGVLASLKGVWRKVAGARTDGDASSAPAPTATPEPAELQTSVDEADVPASTAAGLSDVAPVRESPAAETSAEAEAPFAETAVEAEAPFAETPAEAEAPVAETPVEAEAPAEEPPAEDQPATVGTLVADEADSEPVSESLEVATDRPVHPKAKTQKPAKAQDPALGASAPGLAKSTSPFIAPVSTEAGPDSSWTVAQLRSLAKEHGVRGYSSMSKAQLLGALSSPQA